MQTISDGWMVKFSQSEQKEGVIFVMNVCKTFFLFVVLTAVVGCCDVGVADTTRLAFLLHSPAKDFFYNLGKNCTNDVCMCLQTFHYCTARSLLVLTRLACIWPVAL